ncbi:hypothetical protein HYW41_01590 [Candidatus Daviesbacteria bacterium]|nr:hypothetical protein [Candidatus Daviesbacteria bacterium]
MNRNTSLIIIAILLVGILYRLMLTANGNFLFNMDNARDFVDVREMVELKKLRLTGPTSAIDGLYNGPLWYYFLAISYTFGKGDPYGAIIFEIILWAIGGYFLLKLVGNFGRYLVIPIGLIWVASNYIVLTNLYSFNPNPVTLLTPLFIYGLFRYSKSLKSMWIILTWSLAGAFFNFEMNFGIFTPLIIIISLFLLNKNAFKDKYFWIGVIIFTLTLLPQLLFDLRHQFIMSKAIFKFLSNNQNVKFNLISRTQIILQSFFSVFQATLMNNRLITWAVILLAIPIVKNFLRRGKKESIFIVSLLYIVIPFLGYLIISVTVNPWHLGGPAVALLILIAVIISRLWQINITGRLVSLILSLSLFYFSVFNILNFFVNDLGKENMDPSLYKNEIKAIDYVYQKANGKNFKVYIYLPSVYDYPYQYLFWWYGQKKYGYIPKEYVYSPNKPQYIPSQEKFQGEKSNFSELVFLIKEPDRIKMRQAWENDYKDMEMLSKEMVGPIEVEVRREL